MFTHWGRSLASAILSAWQKPSALCVSVCETMTRQAVWCRAPQCCCCVGRRMMLPFWGDFSFFKVSFIKYSSEDRLHAQKPWGAHNLVPWTMGTLIWWDESPSLLFLTSHNILFWASQRMPSTHIMSRRLLKFVLDMNILCSHSRYMMSFYLAWVTLSMSAMWFHLQYHNDVPTHTLSNTKSICGLSECINAFSLIGPVLSVLSLSLLYT